MLDKETISAISDWNIDTNNVANSALFPGVKRLDKSPELLEFGKKLAQIIPIAHQDQVKGNRKIFGVTCEGIRYRVAPLDGPFYHLRTLHDQVMAMGDLGISKVYTDILRSRELRNRGGLVLIGGATGSGKTTTASTMVIDRLEQFGGYALTLEEVKEYNLDGWHGPNGLCRQTQLQSNYRQEMEWALRAFPSNDRSMFFIGEIVENIAAGELLRTALNGDLVVATVHGNSITGIIERLIDIASQEMSIERARNLLGQSLRVVVHQLREHKVPQITMLNLMDPEARAAVNCISEHENNLKNLQQVIDAQQRKFMMMEEVR